MSSISEYQGEEIFQIFTPCEQVELRRGNRTEAINNKLGIMSFRQFQFETNFTYFHAFLHTIPGCLDPYCLVQSTYRQFTVMKCFVLRERMTVKPINIEITPEGYIFYEDNLIAL